ncbi:uncharacterized protein LOC135839876 [Planococcus citri]|uniref:uncharacterized protein LOC135839876 n=1 Tax=Planococcus citri TaxID=170843 RepID=UPI0031FA2803
MASTSDSKKALEEWDDQEPSIGEDVLEMSNDDEVKSMNDCDDSEPSIAGEDILEEMSKDQLINKIRMLENELKIMRTELSADTDSQDTEEDGAIVPIGEPDVGGARSFFDFEVPTADRFHRLFSQFVAQVIIIFCTVQIFLLTTSYLLGDVQQVEFVNSTLKIIGNIATASLLLI